MPATTTTIESFTVIGIQGRTDNASELAGTGIIAGMWGRFFGELSRIPNRADANIVALYTDYESGAHGAYTFFIGTRVTSTADIPEGMVAREIPGGRYAVFTSERGRLDQVVPAVWQTVWRDSGLPRGFQTDFELYDTRAVNPADGVVDVYVGLK